jgi:hypothetical protein
MGDAPVPGAQQGTGPPNLPSNPDTDRPLLPATRTGDESPCDDVPRTQPENHPAVRTAEPV